MRKRPPGPENRWEKGLSPQRSRCFTRSGEAGHVVPVHTGAGEVEERGPLQCRHRGRFIP